VAYIAGDIIAHQVDLSMADDENVFSFNDGCSRRGGVDMA
jgi:hypothetical protein